MKLLLVVVSNVLILVAVHQVVDVVAVVGIVVVVVHQVLMLFLVDGIVVVGIHQMFEVAASCCFQCLDSSCCSSSC